MTLTSSLEAARNESITMEKVEDNMEKLKKLSVIIPAYNVEKSLVKCVESVVNQTYKNIEIVIVDDGSKDLTPQICDELKNKYENIIVIHQENQGSNKTRETGFNASTGDYIAFLDSDDYIDVTAYEKAIKVLEENDCDIVQFGLYEVSVDGKILREHKRIPAEFNNSREVFLYFIGAQRWNLVDKVYKRSLFENMEWLKISMAEDMSISAQLFAKAQKLVAIEEPFYYYVDNPASITHMHDTDKSKKDDILKAQNFVINFTERNFPEFLPEILWSFMRSLQYIATRSAFGFNNEVFYQYVEVTKGYYNKFISELKKQGGNPKARPGLGGYFNYNIRKKFRLWLFIKFPVLSVMRFKISQKLKIHK